MLCYTLKGVLMLQFECVRSDLRFFSPHLFEMEQLRKKENEIIAEDYFLQIQGIPSVGMGIQTLKTWFSAILHFSVRYRHNFLGGFREER